LLIVDKAGAIFSPRREDIVQGTSLAYVEQLLAGIGMNIEYRDVHFEELYDASEVLLVGNTGCLWPAVSLGKRPIGTTTNGPICATLQERWEKSISFNWRSQALRIADTLASDAQ
jgi:branched-subunit amino acid aminotransferase/4-amino-4-deoxychorismate lyase